MMKLIDTLFSLLCGLLVSLIAIEFLEGYGIDLGFYAWLLYLLLPFAIFIFLWASDHAGRKFLFIFQLAKHIVVGVFATVIDLKVFELLTWCFLTFFAIVNPLMSKAISFLVSTCFKYLGNKNWTFDKPDKEGILLETLKFFVVVMIGLGIDVSSFFYFTKILGPQLGTPEDVWIKASVIFAALIAAVWNFTGEKFLVFKK